MVFRVWQSYLWNRIKRCGWQRLQHKTSTYSPPGQARFRWGRIPGFDVRIVDDDGNELQPGSMGNVVMATPLAPTAFTTLWNDENRFYRSYLGRFNGKWIDPGDAGMIDKDGYISIMSKSSTSLLIDSAQVSCRRQPVFDNRINSTRRY